MKKIVSALFAAFLVFGFISNANAAKTLKCQTVISAKGDDCLLYTSPSPRDRIASRMPSSA